MHAMSMTRMGLGRYVVMSAAGGAAFALVMAAMYAVVIPAGGGILTDVMTGDGSGATLDGLQDGIGGGVAGVLQAGDDALDGLQAGMGDGVAGVLQGDRQTADYMAHDATDLQGEEHDNDADQGIPAAGAAAHAGAQQSGHAPPPPQQQQQQDMEPRPIPYRTAQTATVTRVIDGDTLQVDYDTVIRLALVDTPERGQPGYEEASAFTRHACPAGATVIYDADDGQRGGSYGRLIAMVWCPGVGGESVRHSLNSMLVAQGHAVVDTRFCKASEFGNDEWAKRGGC